MDSEKLKNLKSGEVFLLAELDQLSKALDQTYTYLTKTYQFYLIVAAIPFTAIALLGAEKLESLTIGTIPVYIGWLFNLIALLGLLVSWEIHCIHMRQIHYARAINGIRAYFKDNYGYISEYLVLPCDKARPGFDWIKLYGRQFALVFRISLISAIVLYVGVVSTHNPLTAYWPFSDVIGGVCLALLIFVFNFFLRYLISGQEEKATCTVSKQHSKKKGKKGN